MTTMNNEDPADPSVHVPLYTAEELAQHMENDCMLVGWDDVPAMLRSQATEIARLREVIAAERALLLTDIAALREALDDAATDCELHPLYLGDSATLEDIIRAGGDAAFITGLARGLRETLAREQPK